ncbi:MAG: LysM peptidoglycan-binding domain-containing protein [Clostridium sp.]|nr:LysM peptidoglycan-binding domain-containing protein [Clostridium sp.]
MSSYTIKTGDNLWNICKNQFKLNNNTDIANKVKEVAKANNISNPNLIFAGKEINLSVGDTIEKTTEPLAENKGTESNKVTNPNGTKPKNYSKEITQAVETKKKSWDFSSYEGFMSSLNTQVSIFSTDTKTAEQKQQAYFDYSEKLLSEHYDLNNDGIVTTEEFAKAEEQGNLKTNEISRKHDTEIGITSTEEDIKRDSVIANRTANLFATNLDMNGDGKISKEEFAFFNKTADGLDGAQDGKILAAAESAMFQSVTGMNANDKEINRVVNKYLSGETLTAAEQEILNNSSTKIRAAMSKAAGLSD